MASVISKDVAAFLKRLLSGNRKQRRLGFCIVVVLTVFLLLEQHRSEWETLARDVVPAEWGWFAPAQSLDTFVVQRVVDGDTIALPNGEKVRYIGINTPETVKPNSGTECFGQEASVKNKELVEGKNVRLEKDISDRDKYGRLLRYVYSEDGTFVNDLLVREGYAYASTFPPDVKFSDQFRAAQAEARENKRGLWAEETCQGKK